MVGPSCVAGSSLSCHSQEVVLGQHTVFAVDGGRRGSLSDPQRCEHQATCQGNPGVSSSCFKIRNNSSWLAPVLPSLDTGAGRGGILCARPCAKPRAYATSSRSLLMRCCQCPYFKVPVIHHLERKTVSASPKDVY